MEPVQLHLSTAQPIEISRKELDDSWIPAPRVAAHFGVTRRTLGRWLKDEVLDFPRPESRNKRLYFKASEIAAWEKAPRARASGAVGRHAIP